MKRKFRLLSILSAAAMGATLCLTACGTDSVEDHDHVWNDGEVTTESTCHTEGVKTYTCTVDGCEQTKTVPVSMTEHSWNDGEVTTLPTCKKEGVKTYTCTAEGCGKKKEEPVDKTDHRWNEGEITKTPDFFTKGAKKYTCSDCSEEKSEAVPAHADFAEQFYTSLTEQSSWLYGYANSYNTTTGNVDFVRIEQTDETSGTWKATGTEIGKGYVYSENNAVIAYRFSEAVPEGVEANVAITFNGEESNTVLNAYLIITDKDGELKDAAELNSESKKGWSYLTEEAIDIAQGDMFWLIFENVGEGKAGGSLTYTLTAPCVHVWNSGSVKTPATCTEEGETEYSCLSCGEKYTGTIEKVPHAYDDGEETTAPTEKSEGVMTYTCEDCGATRTESIPRLGSSEFNGADFANDFSTVAQPEWKYGYTNNFNFTTNEFTFNEAKPVGTDAWMDNGGIEIKAGWLKNETDGANAVVRYIMPQTREINISLSFNGSDAVTRMIGRLVIQSATGSVELYEFLFNENSNTWTYNDTVTVEKGSAISVLFFNEGSAGWYHGSFSMKLTAEGQAQPTPKPEVEVANFKEDFTLENQNGAWSYGKMENPWNNNERNFVECSDKTSDAWTANDGNVEIKAGWINARSETTIAYTAQSAMSAKLKVTFTGSGENTRLAIRIYAVKDGKISDEKAFNANKNEDGKQVVEISYDFKANETIYIMFSNEEWENDSDTAVPNGNLDITITAEGQAQPTPAPEFEGADFKEDFTTENQDGAWSYGYVDYSWEGGESFEFHKSETFEDGAWKITDKYIQIKAGWIDAGGMATIAYTAPSAVNVKAVIAFVGGTDGTRLALRIGVKNSAGVLYGNPTYDDNGKASKELNVEKTYELKAGDTIYFIFSDEAKQEGCWPNGELNITLTADGQDEPDPAPEFDGANLKDDFTLDSNPNGGWRYGAVNYHFKENDDDKEDFTFIAATEKNEYGWVYNKDDINVDLRGDFLIANKGFAAIAYTFGNDAKVKVSFKFTGNGLNEDADTQFNIRIGIKDKNGVLYSAPEFHDGQVVEVNKEYEFKAGDTIYFIIEHKEGKGWDSGTPEITLTKVTTPEFTGANFAEEFSATDYTDGPWGFHGIDYDWGTDNLGNAFDINEVVDDYLVRKDGDAIKSEIKATEIMADWMCGISYTVTDAMKLNVKLTLAGGEDVGIDVRITVIGSEGEYRTEKADYFGMTIGEKLEIDKAYDLQAGDKIYFIFSDKAEASSHKSDMTLVLTKIEE